MGRRRPDWWLEQQHQQQQRDLLDDGCPRNAANARERARMRVLSKAFGRLKTTLPWVPADTKLSKLDTLRLATTYIAHLSSLLTTAEQPDVTDQRETATQVSVTSTQPLNYAMTWPYNAHNTVKECSSADDDEYRRYDCYNDTLEEKSYSTYDTTYYKSSINS